MPRLLVHVEGLTEETFVGALLGPFLYERGFASVSARLVGNARQRERRGGIKAWESVRKDIINHLKGDAGCCSTMMVDYYALPQGDGAWPGRAAATGLPFVQKAAAVEGAILADVVAAFGDARIAQRFVPFVVMHEFEGLLFSDCGRFGQGIGRRDLAAPFQAIRDQFPTPEEIDDSPLTAPSKRIQALIPGYEKPLLGNLAALEIGLERIRDECPHFRDWLVRLAALVP